MLDFCNEIKWSYPTAKTYRTGPYKMGGHKLLDFECACGWKSDLTFESTECIEKDWERHVQTEMIKSYKRDD